MPVDLDFVAAVRCVLIPALKVTEPRTQMFLRSAMLVQGVCQPSLDMTDLWLVLLGLRLDVSLIHVRVPLDIGETIDSECVFGVKWMSIHRTLRERSIVRVFELNKNKPS